MNILNALKPTRRWFQYRLRTLLVFTALCGVAAKWVGDPIIKVQRQARAVQFIRAAGGRTYDCLGHCTVPTWMQGWFGIGPGFWISHVRFAEESGDADLATLDDLPDLLFVIGCGSQVTDAGLEHLQGLRHLESVNLSKTRITGAGLVFLNKLTNLKRLDLSHTHVTDAGLRYLQGLTNLTELDLHGTQVTDAGLPYLKMLANLKDLDLYGTQVSFDGVKRLQQALPNCAVIGPADQAQ